MQANARLALETFTLSAAGVCGASLMVASVALSAPDNQRGPGGQYMVALINDSTTVPLHVDSRITYTDPVSAVVEVPWGQYLVSNSYTYGGSAIEARSLVLLPSGKGVGMPLDNIAGSALRIYILAASNPASATVVSGSVTVWRV